MHEIKQLIHSYEEFLRGADKVLELLRKGELRSYQKSAAEEIASVETQIRDVERILPTLRTYAGAPE